MPSPISAKNVGIWRATPIADCVRIESRNNSTAACFLCVWHRAYTLEFDRQHTVALHTHAFNRETAPPECRIEKQIRVSRQCIVNGHIVGARISSLCTNARRLLQVPAAHRVWQSQRGVERSSTGSLTVLDHCRCAGHLQQSTCICTKRRNRTPTKCPLTMY